MAGNDNRQLEEARRLLQEINTLRARLNQQPLRVADADAVSDLQSLRNELRGVQAQFGETEGTATSLYDQIKAISGELGRQPSALSKIRGNMRKITSIAEDLKMQEQGIKDLSTKQLDDLTERLKLNKKQLSDEAESLLNATGIEGAQAQALQALREQITSLGGVTNLTGDQRDLVLDTVQATQDLTDEQKSALALYIDQDNALGGINTRLEEVKAQQKEVNKLMGVGGAVVDGLDGLMGKLGMSSSRFKDAVSESKDKMKAVAEEIQSGARSGGRLTVLMAGLGPLAKGFGAALFDPLTIILKIVDSFIKVDKAATKFQQRTGMSAESLAGANMELATSVDFLETAGELTDQLGINAAVALGPDIVAGAAALKNELGLSAENVGVLALNAKLSGTNMAGLESQIQSATDEFNNTNDAAISSTQVIRDMGKASKAVQAQFAGYPGGLAKAAAAARKVGMELKDIEGVMDNMLDFQSSIESEMEAELLTGKQLNLNKARELSLANDIEGVSNELFKNAQDVSQFGKMNRLEQQSYAAALGMSRDQLAEMAVQKGIQANMTAEEIAKLRGVTLEESKRMDIQEKLNKSVEKLTEAFTPVLSIIGDIVSIIAPAVQLVAGIVGYAVKFLDTLGIIKPLLIGIVAVMAAGKIAGFFGVMTRGFLALKDNVKGLDLSLGGIKDKFKSLAASAKEGLSGLKDKFMNGFRGTTPAPVTEAGTNPVTETVTGATDRTVEASNAASRAEDPKSSGEKLKEFFTNLAAGLKEMASTKVVGGALALIPASIGLVAFIPGYFGAKLMERIDGEKLRTSLEGLAYGLQAMASGKTILGSLALIAASVGLVAMIPGVVGGLLLAAAAAPIATGLVTLAGGLVAFGTAMASGVGLLGLAALVGAVIGLGFALKIAAPGIEAFGAVITSAFNGLSTLVGAVADGFAKLMDSVTLEKVMNMALLGPALLGAAAGLTAFSAAMAVGSMAGGITSFLTGGGLLADLQTLVEMAGPLQSVATSLTAIAGALAGIGIALATVETEKLDEIGDLVMTTALAGPAIAAAGAIGDMIAGITGGGSGEKSESNDKLIAKIDELIVAVKQGKNINMDGRRVGTTLQLSASNT